MKKHPFLWVIIAYFVLNIFNTYFLTTMGLNKYITTFNHTFLSELFSLIGNFGILAILLLIGVVILRKPKWVTYYLLVISFVLNVAIIALQYYEKGYRLAFSLFNFTLFKSPTGGFGSNVFLDWVVELFIYYRIICLLPFITILVLFLVFRKTFVDEKIKLSWVKYVSCFVILIGACIGSYEFFQTSLKKKWNYSTDYAQFGCQYTGAYNYYISEFVFHIDNRNIKKNITKEEAHNDLSAYNKNKNSYTNIIDGKTYSNIDKQTGILKDKNIFIIQMESTMSFCFNQTYNDVEVTPNLNRLFKDNNCFYFDNVYTTVGIGNTSDAEFAFFTGYYPTGDITIAWEYDEYDFDMYTLGDYFKDYRSYSYNPTNENFYNHNNLHEGLYKMTDFRGLETYEKLYPKAEHQDKYLNYWISDASILNWASETQKNANQSGYNAFSFIETITPHNPFNDLSDALPNFNCYDYGLKSTYYQLTNYLNQVKYNDKLIYDFIQDACDPNSPNYLKDTVFVIYGDHGNTLSKSAYENLFKENLTDIEFRKLILNIPVIFYDPSGAIYETMKDEPIDRILSQTKSNTDMYRTIVNLFGFEPKENYYGVNMFSGEPNFTYDPKNLDIITDNFFYCKKNGEFEVYSAKGLDENLIDYISKFRQKQDDYINTLVYKSKKR